MTSGKNKRWKFPKTVFTIFLVVFFALYIQYAYLALSPSVYGINMDDFAAKRSTVSTILNANRGTIFDTTGNSLALNVSSYTVIAYLDENRSNNSNVPLHVADKEGTAKSLSSILGMTEEYILGLLNWDVTHGSKQVELGPGGRGITEITKEEIESLNLPGIDFIETQKRYYPNGDFASYIIGYAKTKTITDEETNEEVETIVGELGIESKYNDWLKGKDGYIKYQRDRFGYKIPDTKEEKVEEEDGNNIYLTIDSNIQRFAESAVKEQSAIYNPEWMIVTVMNAKTGEILASATSPSFDPNIRNIENYENPLSSYLYEPGSTMKTYAYMCAIEKGTYDGSLTYESGSIEVDNEGNKVNDWNPSGWGTLTFDQGYVYSSNVAIANMVKTFINREDLRNCYEKYGFGKQTEIELSRELAGTIDFTYPLEVAAAGYGQGITTTPIQHLQALTMIANDGIMLKPHIISKIVDSNTDDVIYETDREELGQIVSSETAQKMRNLMYDTVNASWATTSANMFKIDGTTVIGKSGTAQIFDNKSGKYLTGTNNYVFSFAGMFPYENPEIIIYAAMKQPESGGVVGLSKATNSVMANTAKYLQIVEEKNDSKEEIELGSYLNKNIEDLEKLKEKIDVIIIGNGNKIVKQYPNSGTTILEGDKLFIVTNDSEITMPNVINYSKIEAINLLKLLNIDYELDGYGYVLEQSIKSGDKITDKVKITLKNKSYIRDIKGSDNS